MVALEHRLWYGEGWEGILYKKLVSEIGHLTYNSTIYAVASNARRQTGSTQVSTGGDSPTLQSTRDWFSPSPVLPDYVEVENDVI